MDALAIVKTIAILAGVIALIFGLAWLLRRLNLSTSLADGGNEGWRVLAVKMIGPKRQIYVMEVGSRILLIGFTDKTMTPLMEVHDPAEREKLLDALGRRRKAPVSFKDFLHRAQS